MSLARQCGDLLVVGFPGQEIPASFARAISRGERGGIILFRRNLPRDLVELARLLDKARRLFPNDAPPPVFAIDQEGGRVARLGPPLLQLPPALRLGTLGHALLGRIARCQAEELAVLGFTTSFAPVLDVHSEPTNPVIGDRAFSSDPEIAGARAMAFARGLREGGLFACGKHYPGHGATTADSHLELPVVEASRERLMAREFVPFRQAAEDGIDALMTAHVVYPALDDLPATLSPVIATQILRGELRFRGTLFSDDLEMKALRQPIEELAVAAILAGCDALLICSDEEKQERAFGALMKEAERSVAFRMRIEEANMRVSVLKSRFPPRPRPGLVSDMIGCPEARALESDLLRQAEAQS